MNQQKIPGWFGKMPAVGDFTSKRLPSDFITLWDTWLQKSIVSSRLQLGDDWLNSYLNCPVWRFILMPELCADSIWAGVLMPSVDKINRFFPLTIAQQFEVVPGMLTSIIHAQNWFAEIEKLALKSLHIDFSPEDLDHNLLKHPLLINENKISTSLNQKFSIWQKLHSNDEYGSIDIPQLCTIKDMPLFFSFIMEHHFIKFGTHKSIWWCEMLDSSEVQFKCFAGLPETDHFISLLKDGGSS